MKTNTTDMNNPEVLNTHGLTKRIYRLFETDLCCWNITFNLYTNIHISTHTYCV